MTTRTIQNYYHPTKRNRVAWRLLELYATGRILPDTWGLIVKGDRLATDTGYEFHHYDLEQISHVHSIKDNTINGQRREIDGLREKVSQLESELQELRRSEPVEPKPSNVVAFAPRKHQQPHGDSAA